MKIIRGAIVATVIVAFVGGGVPSARAGDLFFLSVFERKNPTSDKEHPVERLAKEIDWLEHYIDQYGTVVPKQPDIWGQARLTKHRHEFETQMRMDLGNFHETLQASIRRVDQSFLGMAFALNAVGDARTETTVTTNAAGERSSESTPTRVTPTTISAGTPTDGTDLPGAPAFARSLGKDSETLQLSLEPTIVLAQKARYLNYLNELRRINEGDDTADSPGYALHLIRIPVSVLPGKKTDRGYGAEITVTMQPSLTDELLPATFRNLVINDVIDQLSLPLTKILHEKWQDDPFWKDLRKGLEAADKFEALYAFSNREPGNSLIDALWEKLLAEYPGVLAEDERVRSADAGAYSPAPPKPALTPAQAEAKLRLPQAPPARSFKAYVDAQPGPRASDADKRAQMRRSTERVVERTAFRSETDQLRWQQAFRGLSVNVASFTGRRSRLAFPPSQLGELAGSDYRLWGPLLLEAYATLKNQTSAAQQVHIGDVRAYLQAEVDAAYDFLVLPEAGILWDVCNPANDILAMAIRGRKRGSVEVQTQTINGKRVARFEPRAGAIGEIRSRFIDSVRSMQGKEPGNERSGIEHTPSVALTWAIIVEATLLNERLNEDMREVAQQKGCACLGQDGVVHSFYMPRPDPAAAQVFIEYVRCRWPIHVFALDPVTDDQNIADIYRARREMQVAASVAVANGYASPSAAMRFMRQLEVDIDTIALNRTTVAFSHGGDTFGWRFYPRVQTPPTRGNARAFYETLAGGPTTKQMLKDRQLEPGMRECVAIVVMPSFVPYVKFETRANWFSLINPSHKEMTLHDSMKISRMYQSVRQSACQTPNSPAYRDGDVCRLMASIEQIDRRLPLQSMLAQVPFENTLGGFEMFSSGVTDLGPELIGWYGEPGVRLGDGSKTCPTEQTAPGTSSDGNPCAGAGSGTTLFLVGNNFSVHETQVVAGGRCVPFLLLSRQVMRVSIPCDVRPVISDGEEVIDVHVATPYGVSSHLAIPVANPPAAPAPKAASGFGWADVGPFKALAEVAIAGHVRPTQISWNKPPADRFLIEVTNDASIVPLPTMGTVTLAVRRQGNDTVLAKSNPIKITLAQNQGGYLTDANMPKVLADLIGNAVAITDVPLTMEISGVLSLEGRSEKPALEKPIAVDVANAHAPAAAKPSGGASVVEMFERIARQESVAETQPSIRVVRKSDGPELR